jgi:hypothetical protein
MVHPRESQMKVKCKTCGSKLNTNKFKNCNIAGCPIRPMVEEHRVTSQTLVFGKFKEAVVKPPKLVESWESPEPTVEPPVTTGEVNCPYGSDFEGYCG